MVSMRWVNFQLQGWVNLALRVTEGKEQVKVVCIDLSSTYRYLVQQYFPNAKIVADRFHVIRLMQHMCMQTYQDIDPKMKNKRGILISLRTNPENLVNCTL